MSAPGLLLSLQGAESYPAGRLKGQAGLLKSQKPGGALVDFPLPLPGTPPSKLREDSHSRGNKLEQTGGTSQGQVQ